MAIYKFKRKLFGTWFGLGISNFKTANNASTRAAAAARRASAYKEKISAARTANMTNTDNFKKLSQKYDTFNSLARDYQNLADKENIAGMKNALGGTALYGGTALAGIGIYNKLSGNDINK